MQFINQLVFYLFCKGKYKDWYFINKSSETQFKKVNVQKIKIYEINYVKLPRLINLKLGIKMIYGIYIYIWNKTQKYGWWVIRR